MSTIAITQIDLLLLGLLQDRPMHGYELYQHARHEGIDGWFNITMPGVYYSLGKLRDRELISESRQRRSGGADKAIYRLTDAGRGAFFEALEKQVAGQTQTYFEYDLGIYLLNRLPLQSALNLLEQRSEFLTVWGESVESELRRAQETGQPPHQVAILDLTSRFIQMEQAWLDGVVAGIHDAPNEATHRSQRGLMVLSGTLHEFHLPDLIRLIASGKHSGTLTVTDGADVRNVGFTAGRPTCVASFRSDGTKRWPASVEETADNIYDLFRWQEGQFTFDQSVEDHETCVPIDLSVEQLILRGCRWVDNWETIQQLVPSTETIFEVGMNEKQLAELDLQPLEQQIVEAMDGTQDITAIAHSLEVTLFEASRAAYALAAVGALRAGDLSRIRVRRAFREIAELMCRSTIAWRSSPEDRACEVEVNTCCSDLPIRLVEGRISDQTEPSLKTDELVACYTDFLRAQIDVVGRRFGREKANLSFERTIRQLVPELQDMASRYGFQKLIEP